MTGAHALLSTAGMRLPACAAEKIRILFAGMVALALSASCATEQTLVKVGIGSGEITNGAFQPLSVWALRDPTYPAAQIGDLQPSLQIVMSSYTELTCSLSIDNTESGPIAYVLSAFPAANAAITAGAYQVASPLEGSATAPFGMGELVACSGGTYSSCLDEVYASGTITLDSVDSPVTGTFTMTLGDGSPSAPPTTGSFSAPICD